MAQTVKRLSTVWETRVLSLAWEDPLEKEMAIHSSTIAWKIPWTEEPGRLQSMGLQYIYICMYSVTDLQNACIACITNAQIINMGLGKGTDTFHLKKKKLFKCSKVSLEKPIRLH